MLLPLLLLFGAAIIAVACWDDIIEWFKDNKIKSSDYGEMIKQKMDNGNYKVVSGVFSANGTKRTEKVWEAEKLDNELEQRFGSRSKIRIELA